MSGNGKAVARPTGLPHRGDALDFRMGQPIVMTKDVIGKVDRMWEELF